MPESGPPTLRVLLLEDDPDDVLLTREAADEVEWGHFEIDLSETSSQALKRMEAVDYDVALVDYNLGADTGLDFLVAARAAGHDVPAIMITGRDDAATAVAAMQAGVAEFITKQSLTAEVLGRALRAAWEQGLRKKRSDAGQGPAPGEAVEGSPVRRIVQGLLEIASGDAAPDPESLSAILPGLSAESRADLQRVITEAATKIAALLHGPRPPPSSDA